MPGKRRLGLALEGGGGKGAYQIGAWRAFRERGFGFKAVSGMSIGAINGAFIATGDEDAAYAFWMNMAEEHRTLIDPGKAKGLLIRLLSDIGLAMLPLPLGKLRVLRYTKLLFLLWKAFSQGGTIPFLLEKGLINRDRLEDILFGHLDLKGLLRSETDLYIFVYETGDLFPFSGGKSSWVKSRALDERSLRAYLLASASIPLLIPSIEIDKKNYRDGQLGWPDISKPLLDRHLDEVFTVHLRPLKEGVFKNGRDEKFIHIQPKGARGRRLGGTLDFDTDSIESRILMGYKDTKTLLESLYLDPSSRRPEPPLSESVLSSLDFRKPKPGCR